MKITFIQTGGTIDKNYPRQMSQYSFEILEPAFLNVMQDAQPNFEYDYKTAFKKDSLEITEDDRELLLKLCKETPNHKIIITHGTDTMTETANYLNRKLSGKTVILTGSAKPEIFKHSDASFNIGVAVGALNVLGEGIYLAMSGRIYSPEECLKDPKTCKFIQK